MIVSFTFFAGPYRSFILCNGIKTCFSPRIATDQPITVSVLGATSNVITHQEVCIHVRVLEIVRSQPMAHRSIFRQTSAFNELYKVSRAYCFGYLRGALQLSYPAQPTTRTPTCSDSGLDPRFPCQIICHAVVRNTSSHLLRIIMDFITSC